jgi:uncharacterized protein (TIGR00297 family)
VRRWLLGALLGSSIAGLAYWRRALTLDGALAAAAMGCVVFARGGLPASGALLAFFGSSSVLSRVGERRKKSSPLAQAKGARRDAWQVLANGGVATLSVVLGQPRAGFLGALSAAGADTWATELGLLARRPPRLVTTLRQVPAGTSGGVTPEGLAASLGGALVVGLTWRGLGGGPHALRTSLLGGVSGSVFDSLLGATLQAVYRCPVCEVDIETPVHRVCGQRAPRIRGLSWMNNDVVNFLATLAGAAIGAGAGRQTRRDTSGEGANVRRRVGWGENVSLYPP